MAVAATTMQTTHPSQFRRILTILWSITLGVLGILLIPVGILGFGLAYFWSTSPRPEFSESAWNIVCLCIPMVLALFGSTAYLVFSVRCFLLWDFRDAFYKQGLQMGMPFRILHTIMALPILAFCVLWILGPSTSTLAHAISPPHFTIPPDTRVTLIGVSEPVSDSADAAKRVQLLKSFAKEYVSGNISVGMISVSNWDSASSDLWTIISDLVLSRLGTYRRSVSDRAKQLWEDLAINSTDNKVILIANGDGALLAYATLAKYPGVLPKNIGVLLVGGVVGPQSFAGYPVRSVATIGDPMVLLQGPTKAAFTTGQTLRLSDRQGFEQVYAPESKLKSQIGEALVQLCQELSK